MADETLDRLMKADAALSRSFAAAVGGVLLNIIWSFFLGTRTESGVVQPVSVSIVVLLIQLGTYVWYAVASGAAAKALGDAGWKYVIWILTAPLLALLPIPIVSTIIGVSPLSIKFLLGGQLQSAIRQESMAALHQ